MQVKTIASFKLAMILAVAFYIENTVRKNGRSSSPDLQRIGYSRLSKSMNLGGRESTYFSEEKGKEKIILPQAYEASTSHKKLIIGNEAGETSSSRNFKSPANITSKTSDNAGSTNVCLTEGCKLTAKILLRNMDQEVRPCDDFYAFACGNFMKNAKIQEDQSKVDTYIILENIVTKQKYEILNEPIDKKEPRPFKLAKEMFSTCMDTKKIEDLKLKPAFDLLDQLGGWPVLNGDSLSNKKILNWRDIAYKFRSIGLETGYLIKIDVYSKYTILLRRVIDIDEPNLGLAREFLIRGMDEVRVKYYYEYMVDVAVAFGADRDRARRELLMSLQFAMELSHITLSNEERRDVNALFNPMTIEELQNKFPLRVEGRKFDWLDYVNTFLAPYCKVVKEEAVIMNTPKYFQRLAPILEKTPKRVIANYLIWRALEPRLHLLDKETRSIRFAYKKKAFGYTQDKPRWKECADSAFSSSLGSLYVRKYFDENFKGKVSDLVQEIRKEMRRTLKTVEWMDEKTRSHALIKEEAMTYHIAYPNDLIDDKKLAEHYKDVTVYRGEYFKTISAYKQFELDKQFAKFNEKVNNTEWTVLARPLFVNALSNPGSNSIHLPAAILQYIFFSADRPPYLNFGAIGFVVGHEITHLFDDKGCNYDKNGYLKNWWDPNTKSRYLEKIRCIVDQYGKFKNKQHNLTLNGLKCVGESVADNIGARIAYRAYRNLADRGKNFEPKLPFLEKYTPRQLFWISLASTQCANYRPEALRNRILSDSHPPGEYRVKGLISNQKEFAEDFHCSPNSQMNPTKKCVVW